MILKPGGLGAVLPSRGLRTTPPSADARQVSPGQPAHLDVQRFRRGSPELLGAALAASFDEIHLFRRVEGSDDFERVVSSLILKRRK